MSDKNMNGCCYQDKVNHIKCEVSNCVYHAQGNACNAPCIEVTPSHANSVGDTACSTFKAQH